jgi:hypothetical protein
MYLLYLDGSGDPAWVPPHGKSTATHYILAGVCIRDTEWLACNEKVHSVLTSYFGKSIPKDRELHRSFLLYGKEPFNNLSEADRRSLDNDVFQAIEEIKPTLFAASIDKAALKNKYGDNAIKPDHLALRFLSFGFNMFLSRKKEHGIIIMDECEAKKDGNLKDLICDAHENGFPLRQASMRPVARSQTKLNWIVESVMFTPSKDCHLVQLSDFLANAMFANYVRKEPERFKQLRQYFDHDDNGHYFSPITYPRTIS